MVILLKVLTSACSRVTRHSASVTNVSFVNSPSRTKKREELFADLPCHIYQFCLTFAVAAMLRQGSDSALFNLFGSGVPSLFSRKGSILPCSFRSRAEKSISSAISVSAKLGFPFLKAPRTLEINNELLTIISEFNSQVPIERAYTPPSSWYIQPDFLAHEMEMIFWRGWRVVALDITSLWRKDTLYLSGQTECALSVSDPDCIDLDSSCLK
ncbi:hypothetical protein KP509_10G028100 [Ceratopteris richardii]|uniref:Uncharacterized protein n=1 Tax=Ceratopteris richardii TaxID=49495 RepID=A0A8T2TZG1_CERRI|nr:hypothetical protein KP509_10G028100 [Ceratopteris richardii]